MLLVLLKRLLLVTGIGALAYAGVLTVESYAAQHYETLKFDQALRLPASVRTFTLVPGGPMGKLTIPSVGISAIVLEGDDGATLNAAPGHIPGTALPGENGNVAIAGHRDTFFRNLDTIRAGDTITLRTLRGTYQYKVDSTEVVDPSQTEVLQPSGAPTLTLVTCYPFHFIGPAPKRFIVRSRMVHSISWRASDAQVTLPLIARMLRS
jgi:sortase A